VFSCTDYLSYKMDYGIPMMIYTIWSCSRQISEGGGFNFFQPRRTWVNSVEPRPPCCPPVVLQNQAEHSQRITSCSIALS
jgi:hypothetical protein